MFVRFDEEKPHYMKALITGVEGTPYSNGIDEMRWWMVDDG